MKYIRFLFFVSIYTLVSIPSANAGVSVSQKTQYYHISGKSGVAITRDLLRKGRRAHGVRHAVATTTVRLKVSGVKMHVRKNRCRVRSSRIRLNLTYTYPKLRTGKRTSKRVRNAWRTYFAEVVKHEKRHGAIARQYAKSVEHVMQRTTTRKSRNCTNLSAVLKRKLNKLQKAHHRKQISFDRREGRLSSMISRRAVRLIRAH